jgi:hypothetical protein
MFHRDFPSDAHEMWDVLAKALMLRTGGVVTISAAELRAAASTQAEIELDDDGSIRLRAAHN